MPTFKCKMCGGTLQIADDAKIVECDYCGSTQTIPNFDNEKKVNLFTRANNLRFNKEFDKAAGVYESIVAEFPEEAEAYWGLCLCKYGIEYVDDPKTGKKTPTCHRTCPTSILDDNDFERAYENADIMAKSVYRDEAKNINAIQKKILEIVAKEDSYDIFICYKETDDKTKVRTEDSGIAQDIYTELVKEGYKVFFSRVTLRTKAGTEFEPYIYSALSTAKVMLAIGTKYEYYDAVWVKNEWSRFLGMMKDSSDKHFIACYKGLDAEDMPKEFRNLQALNIGDVTFFKNLMTNIRDVLPKNVPSVPAGNVQIPQNPGNINYTTGNNTDALLKRMFIFLDEGEWSRANEYAEKVLDINPECAEAYLGLLLSDQHIRKVEQLYTYSKIIISEHSAWQKAIRYADDTQKARYRAIEQQNLQAYQNARDREIVAQIEKDPYRSYRYNSYHNGFRKQLESIHAFPLIYNCMNSTLRHDFLSANYQGAKVGLDIFCDVFGADHPQECKKLKDTVYTEIIEYAERIYKEYNSNSKKFSELENVYNRMNIIPTGYNETFNLLYEKIKAVIDEEHARQAEEQAAELARREEERRKLMKAKKAQEEEEERKREEKQKERLARIEAAKAAEKRRLWIYTYLLSCLGLLPGVIYGSITIYNKKTVYHHLYDYLVKAILLGGLTFVGAMSIISQLSM